MLFLFGRITLSWLTDTKCYTFSDPQARADLNDYRYFRNGGNVGNLRNVGNVRNVENFRNVRSDRQIPSIIHFWNNMLDLSYMMKSISGLVGMWGMSGMYKKFSVFFYQIHWTFCQTPWFFTKNAIFFTKSYWTFTKLKKLEFILNFNQTILNVY